MKPCAAKGSEEVDLSGVAKIEWTLHGNTGGVWSFAYQCLPGFTKRLVFSL